MSIKEIKSATLYKEFELKIPYIEIENLINSKIKEIIPNVTLPGFRKGKAPISIVRKKYEPNVLSEVMEKLVQEKTSDLVKDKKLKPFRQPRIDIRKYEKQKPIEIEIKIDLKPEIKLKNFKEIKLKKYEINLDQKTIEDNYNQFLLSQKQYAKIEKNRPIKNTDKVTINIETKDPLAPDFIKSQKNIPVITDSDFQILPNLSEKLIQKKLQPGDNISLTFDISKMIKSNEPKQVEFDIDILTIEEAKPFKITDEFLNKNGLKSESELKSNLQQNIHLQYENGIKQIEKKQLMDILETIHKFDLPQGIVDQEFHDIWHRIEQAKKDNSLDEDDKNLSDKLLKDRYKKISERRVKLAILLQHIAKDANISVSEKELSDGMTAYASKYPGQEKKIIEYFKKNPSSIESIRGPILEQKVIDDILSKSTQENVKLTVKEYKKLEEKTFSLIDKDI